MMWGVIASPMPVARDRELPAISAFLRVSPDTPPVSICQHARDGCHPGRFLVCAKLRPVSEEEVLTRSVAWLEKAVIGLNLCPFAKAVHVKNQIRWVVSDAKSGVALLEELRAELELLARAPETEIDTTLLIHPHVLQDFFDYNDFLSEADALLEELELDGTLQIASFHPDYQFAEGSSQDPAHYTNRSPYPMLHLLREDSVSRAVDGFPDTSTIYERNMQTLRSMPATELALLFGERRRS